MSPMTLSRVCLFALAGLPAVPAPALAQEDRGGLTASLILSERLEATRNRALAPGDDDLGFRSVTTLGYDFLSETRTQSLAFGLSLGLDGEVVPGGTPGFSPGERRLSLDYGLEGATSSLELSAGASRSDVAFLRPLSDFIDGGGLVLPEDFDDLTGSGSRTELSFGARVTLREDAPFGVTLGADAGDLRYSDTTDPDLRDSTRAGVELSGRFDIGPAIRATAGLRYSTFDEEGSAQSDSLTYRAGLTLAAPRGDLGLGLSFTPSEAGSQTGFDLSRSVDLPGGSLGARVGVTFPAGGDPILTGGFDYGVELARGTFGVRLDHSVATDAGRTGDVTTSLSVSGDTALAPDLTASLRAGLARYEEAGTDVVTTIADLGASVTYALSPDWSLGAEAGYVLRDTSDAGPAHAQSLSLTLTRRFDARW